MKNNLLICFTIFLFSCQTSKLTHLKPTAEEILNDKFYRDLYIKYQPNKYNKWQELNKLLENDFVSPDELNVIDCRGLNPNSEKLTLRKVLKYNILGEAYKWHEYKTELGRCIMLSNTYSSFFLNQFEASILLSASIGHNFEKLNLLRPKIMYKRTILNDLKGYFCGGTTIEEKENMTIIQGGCSESIYYKYETKKPQKSTSGIIFLHDNG